jgi:hypothetical protein
VSADWTGQGPLGHGTSNTSTGLTELHDGGLAVNNTGGGVAIAGYTDGGSLSDIAVSGFADTFGVGVQGLVTAGGVAVWADSNNAGGTALPVDGPATFSRSGVAVIAHTSASPKSSITVNVPHSVALTSTSVILAVLQTKLAGVQCSRRWRTWAAAATASAST